MHHCGDAMHWKPEYFTLIFQGHLRSKVWATNKSICITSSPCFIGTISLSCTIFKIQYMINKLKSTLWPFKVIQGQRSGHQMTAHIWLPICLTYKLYAYLAPFSRHNALYIWNLPFDLLRSSKVKGLGSKWNLIYDFLSVLHTNWLSLTFSKKIEILQK